MGTTIMMKATNVTAMSMVKRDTKAIRTKAIRTKATKTASTSMVMRGMVMRGMVTKGILTKGRDMLTKGISINTVNQTASNA